MIKAYTYIIGWTERQKFYYGVRYAEGCDPSELWVTYFTSSKYVKEFRVKYGDPDLIKIRQTFDCKDKAIEWESNVLKRMNVINRSDYLNQTDNRAFRHTPGNLHPWFGRSHKKETRQKISKSLSGKNHPYYGTKFSETTKNKISDKLTGRKFSNEHKRNLSISAKKRKPNRIKPISVYGKIFSSRKSAAEKYGVSGAAITKWVQNKSDVFYINTNIGELL